MRHVYQVVGRFTYGINSFEMPIGQADALDKTNDQIASLCDLYKNEKRGSDTFNTTIYIREAWTDEPWITPCRISYIEAFLKSPR